MNFFRPSGFESLDCAGAYCARSGWRACVGVGAAGFTSSKPGLNANAIPHNLDQLRSLRRHGRQLLQRQFGLPRADRQPAQTFRQPLRISGFVHLVACDRRLHRLAIPAYSSGQLLSQPSTVRRRSSTSAIASYSAVFTRAESWAARVSPGFFSNWTFAPIIEVASGRPFNIITGNWRQLPVVSQPAVPTLFVRSSLRTGGGFQIFAYRIFPGTLLRGISTEH